MGFNSGFQGLNKHIIKEIVRQVGYLSELYEDARSEKKISKYLLQWIDFLLV